MSLPREASPLAALSAVPMSALIWYLNRSTKCIQKGTFFRQNDELLKYLLLFVGFQYTVWLIEPSNFTFCHYIQERCGWGVKKSQTTSNQTLQRWEIRSKILEEDNTQTILRLGKKTQTCWQFSAQNTYTVIQHFLPLLTFCQYIIMSMTVLLM